MEHDGLTFDSTKEYKRWVDLNVMLSEGTISDLQRQVPFELIPEQREPDTTGPRGGVRRGKLIERPVSYVADFVYCQDEKLVVEDTKGVRTPEYIIKRKLMLYVHNIKIKET